MLPPMVTLTLLALLSSSPDAEVARIQEHLRGAAALLAQRDLGGLTAEQRHLRRVNEARLTAYLEAGRFPRNRQVPGRVPVFRDEEGTLCAVGALLWASGEHALVEHIVATRNTATVPQLADEPGLAAWLDTQGLTLAEAARIQPSYGFQAFRITTPPYGVPAGACSPPVTLAPDNLPASASLASVSASSATAELFSDATCTTLLVPDSPLESPRISTASTLYFRDTTRGMLRLNLANQGSQLTQVHDILAPDAKPTRGPEPGCDVTIASPLLLLGLLLARRNRLRSPGVPALSEDSCAS